MAPQKKKAAKRILLKFSINCAAPMEDEIFDIASFEKFLNNKIKVNGKTGVLGDIVTIERDDAVINVTSKTSFSKGYLKYLTKKFLKKQQLRDYIRVISSDKTSYDLRYFTVQNDEENDE